MRRSIVTMMMVTCAGCAAIPLSTMWRFRDFTPEKFFAVDPTQIRAAVRVDERTKRGAASPYIEVRLTAPSIKPACDAFALIPVGASAPTELQPETAANRRWYVFRMSPEGIAAFERARREVRTRTMTGGSMSLNVTLTDVFEPASDAKHFPMRLDLALDRRDGYFTMFKETDVLAMDKPKNDAPATTKDVASTPCAAPSPA